MSTTPKPLFPADLIAQGRQREHRALARLQQAHAPHLPDDTDRPPEPAQQATDQQAGEVSKARQRELLRMSGIPLDDDDDDQQPQAEGGIIVSEARQRELMRLSGFTD